MIRARYVRIKLEVQQSAALVYTRSKKGQKESVAQVIPNPGAKPSLSGPLVWRLII